MKKIIGQFIAISIFLVINISAPTAETSSAVNNPHKHTHEESSLAGLSLNNGNKWETDAPLREGMHNIKEFVINTSHGEKTDSQTQKDALKLSKQINEQITNIIKNCKLVPEADANLHLLIGELVQGADALAKHARFSEGISQIHNALILYPDFFNHPGWNAILEK